MTNKYVGNVLLESIKKELVPYLDDIINKNKEWYPKKLMQYITFNTIFSTMFGFNLEY